MKYNLSLKMTDGNVKAGVFAQVSLSKPEHALMLQSLGGSHVELIAVEEKKTFKPAVKKVSK